MNLFDNSRHHALSPENWNPEVARKATNAIIEETKTRFSPAALWPVHELDKVNPKDEMGVLTDLYIGAAGIIFSAHLAAKYLQDQKCLELTKQMATTLLLQFSRNEDELSNWPMGLGDEAYLVQWCHGAPGIVCSLASIFNELDHEELRVLEQAGHLIWKAGPVRKGHGLCHGTSGNGYSFLKLYHLTKNSLWLERARAFAMAAVAQYEQARKAKPPRFSLWSGDLGLTMYLKSCESPEIGLPTFEYL